MENSEAIKILNQYDMNFYRDDGSPIPAEQIADAVDLAIAALEQQEKDRWIPVTKRLPEEDEDALVTVHFLGLKNTYTNGWNEHIKPSFYVDIAKHYSGEWSSASDEYKVARSRHIVTAWRPLPEPYQEDKE